MPFKLADHLKWASEPEARGILCLRGDVSGPFPAVDEEGSINLLMMADILSRGGQVENQDKVTAMVLAASRFGCRVTNFEHGMPAHNRGIQAHMASDAQEIAALAGELGARRVLMPFGLRCMAYNDAARRKLITGALPKGSDGPEIVFHTTPYSFDFASIGNISPDRPESIFFASLNHRTGIRGFVLYAEGLQYRWERSMEDDRRNPGGQKCLPI